MLGKLKPQSGPDLVGIANQIVSFTSEGNRMPDAEQKAHGHSLGMIDNMMQLINVIRMPDVTEEVRYKAALKSVGDMHRRILNRLNEHLGPEVDDFDKGVSNLAVNLMFRLQQAMILENPNHANEINKTFPKFEDKSKIQSPKKTLSGLFIEGIKEGVKVSSAIFVGVVLTNAVTNVFFPSSDEGVPEEYSKVEYVDFREPSHCSTLGYTEVDCVASWNFAGHKSDQVIDGFKYNREYECEDIHGEFSCWLDIENMPPKKYIPRPYAWRAAAYNITDQTFVEPIYPSAEVGFSYLGSGEKIAFDK